MEPVYLYGTPNDRTECPFSVLNVDESRNSITDVDESSVKKSSVRSDMATCWCGRGSVGPGEDKGVELVETEFVWLDVAIRGWWLVCEKFETSSCNLTSDDCMVFILCSREAWLRSWCCICVSISPIGRTFCEIRSCVPLIASTSAFTEVSLCSRVVKDLETSSLFSEIASVISFIVEAIRTFSDTV